MHSNTAKKLTGPALAMAAAGLLLGGCAMNSSMDKSSAMEAKVHCSGVNSCKGQTQCKSASNNCKGQNSCKGKGWLEMSKTDCTANGGTVI